MFHITIGSVIDQPDQPNPQVSIIIAVYTLCYIYTLHYAGGYY